MREQDSGFAGEIKGKMRHFGAYTPVLGLRKDWPSVLLEKTFTPDCENIQFWNGEVRTAKMRRKHLLRQFFACTESGGDVIVTGDKTTEIPDGSDVLAFDDDAGTVYENASVSYDGTSTTISASGETISGSYIALYTADMETDPTDSAFLQVPVPDGYEIVHYEDLLTDNNEILLFAFTKRHIYLWLTTTTNWLEVYEASADIEHWSSITFNGYIIVTDNTDVPLVWTGLQEADSFEGLGGTDPVTGADLGPEIIESGARINRAKFVTSFEGHVVFGNYSLSDGNDYYNGIIWSDLDDHTYWRTDDNPSRARTPDTGAAYVEGDGVIDGGFGRKKDMLYVFKDRSIRVFWYTGTSFIFNNRPYQTAIGCICPDSIVNDSDGNLYFYASDMQFREVDLGIISNALGDDSRNIVQTKEVISKLRGTYIAEYDEVWWSVPLGAAATANNTTFCYRKGVWYSRNLAVSAFGQYRMTETYTWDTWPFNSWDEIDWPAWDSPAGVSGWPLDLAADYTGMSHLAHDAYTDAGAAYTSYFTLATDLGDLQTLRWYKRLLAIQLFLQKVGDESITVYVKRDNEINWQTAGTISVTGSDSAEVLVKRLPVDYRAKRFQFKISATTPFRFLGMEFDFNVSGER
jgi:hypothetical protein